MPADVAGGNVMNKHKLVRSVKMQNWNYELARKHVDGIADVTTRRLAQLFLTQFYFLALQRYAIPENSEIDLLCYAKIIEKIVSEHALIMRCLEGEDLDSPWNALADGLQSSGERDVCHDPECP